MIPHLTSVIFHFFKSLGLFGAFLSMVIENIGIPLPTEIGYLIAQARISLEPHLYFWILLLLTSGHLIGSLISYEIGRLADKHIINKFKKSGRLIEVHEKLVKWYKNYGNLTVFISRFVGYVRPWASFVAGFSHVKFWPFVIWTFLGSLIFNAIALYFSGIFLLIWRKYTNLHFLFFIIGFLLFFGYLIYELIRYLNNKRKSK